MTWCAISWASTRRKHPRRSKVESFMRTNVFSAPDRGVLECAERMARGSVDTLLVTDEENRYVGTVSIGDIRHWGRELNSIEPLIRQTARTPGWAMRPRRASTTCWTPAPTMWWY